MPVAETFVYDCVDHCLVIGACGQQSFQFGPECEPLDVCEQGIDALSAFVLVDEREQLLEHARSGARGGYELYDGAVCGLLFVTGHGGIDCCGVGHEDAVVGRGGAHDFQKGKSLAEMLDLPFDGLGRQSVRLDLL